MSEITLNNVLKLYTRSEAAKLLSISKKSLCDLIEEGKIGVLIIKEHFYIPHEALAKFIQINTVYLNKNLEIDEEEIDLEKVRRQSISSTFNSVNLLTKIMEQNNGKHLH